VTVADLNQSYAIVGVGNRTVIMELGVDRSIVELWDFDHFRKKLIKETVRVRLPDGKIKVMGLADFWLKHRQGRQYNKLVYAMPGSRQQAGPNDYNGWQGFSVEPKPGCWDLNREHIRHIICNGDPFAFKWVMNWSAALIQFPGRHAWVALVMKSGQGTGKGHYANNMIGRLFGPQQYIHILGSGQLTGEHNEHLSGKCFVFADESTWGGDPRAAAKIKGLITEDTTPIHRKFLKIVDEPSMLHICIASNNEWPIPIEPGDRRFTVLEVSEEKKQDQRYFGQLLAELKNGGHAAMLAELLEHEIDDDMLRIPYNTDAKASVAIHTLKPVEHWWFSLLQRGAIINEEWPYTMVKRNLHDNYMAFLDRYHPHNRERKSTEMELGWFLKRHAPITQQKTLNGKSERVVTIPPLDVCRLEWLKSVGWRLTYTWKVDDEVEPEDDGGPPPPKDLEEM